MHLKSEKKNLSEIFNGGFYKIPRFQRPYSWKSETLEEFWIDILNSDKNYFIGSLVFFIDGDPTKQLFGLVDGQQRLTTTAIFFAVIRDIADSNEFIELADGLHPLIERKNIDSQTMNTIYSETSSPYLQEQIFNREKDESIAAKAEEKNLETAKDNVTYYIDEYVKGLDGKKLEDKLKELRDKMLSLNVISIEVGTEDEAYVIFETLNSKGENLQLKDLVKNHLAKLWGENHKHHDKFIIEWNKVLESFFDVENKTPKIIDQFLLHQWLSKDEYSTEKQLYKKIKKAISSESNSKNYTKELVEDAEIYKSIIQPKSHNWKKEEYDIRDSLKTMIEIFRIKQPIPLLLSLLRAYKKNKLSLKNLVKTLTLIENFHFQFSALASNRSSGGLSQLYAKSAREIYKAKDQSTIKKVIDELTTKIKAKDVSESEFSEAFDELRFSNKFTREKKLLSYILVNIHKNECGAGLNVEDITLEHILPQSTKLKDFDRIGNLIVTGQKTNEKLAAKDFSGKKPIMKKAADVCVDPVLEKSSKWTDVEISERREHQKKIARKLWKYN